MVVGACFYIALATVLVRKYMLTRDKGYVWLGIAFLLWPLIQHGFGILQKRTVDFMFRGQAISWFPASLVHPGGMTAGAFVQDVKLAENIVLPILLIIAIYNLGKRQIAFREPIT
jgi:hypothetical protein